MPNQEAASAWIFWNRSVRVGTQGLFCPYLKTFGPAFSPYPTDCPWVSEDGKPVGCHQNARYTSGFPFPTLLSFFTPTLRLYTDGGFRAYADVITKFSRIHRCLIPTRAEVPLCWHVNVSQNIKALLSCKVYLNCYFLFSNTVLLVFDIQSTTFSLSRKSVVFSCCFFLQEKRMFHNTLVGHIRETLEKNLAIRILSRLKEWFNSDSAVAIFESNIGNYSVSSAALLGDSPRNLFGAPGRLANSSSRRESRKAPP